MVISRWILLRMRNVSHKSWRENQNTHSTFTNFFWKRCSLWDNVEKCGTQPDRPHDNIIWRVRFACWIPNAKDAHSEYVILTAFPRQQRLRERAETLSLYEHCLSCVTYFFSHELFTFTQFINPHIFSPHSYLYPLISVPPISGTSKCVYQYRWLALGILRITRHARYSYILRNVHTGSGPHTAPYSMGTVDSLAGNTMIGALSWPLIFIQWRSLEWEELCLHGTHKDNSTFTNYILLAQFLKSTDIPQLFTKVTFVVTTGLWWCSQFSIFKSFWDSMLHNQRIEDSILTWWYKIPSQWMTACYFITNACYNLILKRSLEMVLRSLWWITPQPPTLSHHAV
jgi:hypothetical protein